MIGKTIDSIPGAISFRFAITVILILILIVVFLRFFDSNRKVIEQASIRQTQKVIDSALLAVFTSYAARGQLNDLNEIEGQNPFEYLQKYNILPASYRGEIGLESDADHAPGWYYLKQQDQVIYIPFYLESKRYFEISFRYQDKNQSGRFEHANDKFNNLNFIEVTSQ